MANRILVVEDDTAISELICMNLEIGRASCRERVLESV